MHALLLAVGLALASQTVDGRASSAPAQAAKPEQAPVLAPRAPIDGTEAIEALAELVYTAAPGRTHTLRVSYAFPDRARLYMSVGGPEGVGERRLRYRSGSSIYALDPRQAQSVEYKAEDRDTLILSFETRRALYLWPHGYVWTGEGRERDAQLAPIVAGGPPAGRLHATLDESGRPVRIDSYDAKGGSGESLRAIVWREGGGRLVPSSHELWLSDGPVWKETLVALERDVRLLDAFFLPPDRRPKPPAGVQTLDLPAHRMLRIALPKGTTLEQAAARWRQERDDRLEALRAVGTKLEARVTVEVDGELRPTHLLLRMAEPPSQPAPMWMRIEERLGYAQVHATPPTDPALLTVLKDAAKGNPQAAPYIRFDPDGLVPSYVLVQPLAP